MNAEQQKALAAARARPVDHSMVFVEEFDAMMIELRVPADESRAWGAATVPATAASRPKTKKTPRAMPMPKPTTKPPTMTPTSGEKLKFPAKLHARKVASELGLKDGLIYLPGLPGLLFEDSDMGPQFRQRRYFYYLGGVDFEDCAVTYDLASDNLVLWVPYIDPRQVLWYGTSPGPAECKDAVDVDDVRYTQGLDSFLRTRLGLGSAAAGTLGASVGSSFCRDRHNGRLVGASLPPPTPLLVLHPDQAPAWLQAAAGAEIDAKRLLPAMDAARVVKTPYEIAKIRQANAISSSAHRAVIRSLKTMANEREIESLFLHHCNAVFGAKHQAYGVIAGSGANAGVLHYFANDEPLAGRQLVCLDAGAECDLYASDVTRTFPISGTFTPEAAVIYAAVDRMQIEVFERFRPGAAFRDLHLHAALVAADELLRIGLFHGGTAREILAAGTVAAFFPHGLGHHVGLEVHDVLSSDLMARAPEAAAAADQEHEARRAAAAAAAIASAASARPVGRGTNAGGKRLLVSPQMYATMVRDADAEAQSKDSVKPAAAKSGAQKRRLLEPGMIVTVEPGIYFCRPYIESFYLSDPQHARFINTELLEQYYDVGGVRIEDCLLVTQDGHENLTTAPKGEEALRIINGK